MHLIDFAVAAVIVIAVCFALRQIYRNRAGGCYGSCAQCGLGCAARGGPGPSGQDTRFSLPGDEHRGFSRQRK